MRKPALSFVIALVLLLAQQGGLWHSIGHLPGTLPGRAAAEAAPSAAKLAAHTGHAKHLAADGFCATCLVYASLAGLAQPVVPVLLLADVRDVQTAAAGVTRRAARALAPRSRGPPAAV